MEGYHISESGFEQGTPLRTPNQKLGLHESVLQTVNLDNLSPSSATGSSVASLKEGSGSSSSSFSDSEPESFNSSVNHYHRLPVNTDGKGLLQEIELKEESPGLEQQNHLAAEDKADNILWDKENRSYEELLRKFIKNEEELRISNLKLQASEKEIGSLKSQIERSQGQLDHVQKELKMREDDLKHEKGQLMELQKQTADLETHVPDCCYKIAKLVEELEVAREQLKVSNDEIARLRNELDRSSDATRQLQVQLEAAQECVATFKGQLDSGRKQIQELEDRILSFEANESRLELEMQKLNAEILDSQSQFSLEKEQLQSEISSLSEEKVQLDSRLEEWESRSNLFENKLIECEAEKVKLEELHSAHQMILQGEVSRLKEELDEKRHGIESLNKEFDRHKHKYDMLMTEKDGANAKIHRLVAEVSSRDNLMENMERELCQLHSQQAEVISVSEARLRLVNDLKLKVEELETEVARQKAVIADRAEEKREAIRQLCFSLEHYRSGYQELRQAFVGHKRQAVIAS
ncbi:hypothetical protein L6164_030211 [Bauhinia variegata]|uniref:Uncharacterized protein n=1 Tax=Bauhinia variegata TaxID=167791 RepID=A0ACB9LBZ6_BAUVA|nr:hypothetical protein L6164_030211 [Bauhinia variegata]